MSTNRVYRVAVIPGDGIGKEVMPEGVRALEAVAKRYGFELRQDWFDFASCDYYEKHQRMMPEDWKEKIGGHGAIFFGAVGWPAKVPDHISLWGSLIQFRREFDQYVNLRPVRLMPGVPCPLVGRKLLSPGPEAGHPFEPLGPLSVVTRGSLLGLGSAAVVDGADAAVRIFVRVIIICI